MNKSTLEQLIDDRLRVIVTNKINTLIDNKLDEYLGDKVDNILTDKFSNLAPVAPVVTEDDIIFSDSDEELPWLETDVEPETLRSVGVDGSFVPIRKFDLSWMSSNSSCCIIGKRGAGKSTLCDNIMKHIDNKYNVIISPAERMNAFYKQKYPDAQIHYNYDNEIVNELLMKQQYGKNDKNNLINGTIVMDDCLASKGKWAKDEQLHELLMNGRHYELMYILTMQFPLGLQPELRGNFDYIFLFAEDFVSNQRRIYDHYAGMFPSFSAFKQVFTKLTEDYGVMVIANRGSRKSLLDKVFWYKAKKIDNKYT